MNEKPSNSQNMYPQKSNDLTSSILDSDKSESGSSDAHSDSGVTDIYMEQLSALVNERVSIAQKKLNKDKHDSRKNVKIDLDQYGS